jgi:hypothetical protein
MTTCIEGMWRDGKEKLARESAIGELKRVLKSGEQKCENLRNTKNVCRTRGKRKGTTNERCNGKNHESDWHT